MGSNRRGWAKWDRLQGLTLIHNQQLQHVRLSALNSVLVIKGFVFPCLSPFPERITQAVYFCMHVRCGSLIHTYIIHTLHYIYVTLHYTITTLTIHYATHTHTHTHTHSMKQNLS